MPALKEDVSRYARLASVALLVSFGAIGLLVLPIWIRAMIPLGFGRRATVAFLLGLFYAHWSLLILSFFGALISIVGLRRTKRGERARGGVMRGLALSISCLTTLFCLEVAAALWTRSAHQAPALPTTFEDKAPRLRERFDPNDRREDLSIVVIGGSSAHGDPYDKWLSIGTLVGWKVQEAFPERRVKVNVLAEPGASLEIMHKKLATLTEKPDILIVYSGHIEFQARFLWLKIVPYYVDEFPAVPSRRVLLAEASRISPLSGLIEETLEKYRLSIPPPPPVNAREIIDHPMCSPAEADDLAADFLKRLEMIVSFCERVGCLPVLVIPPGNDGRYDPDRSIVLPTADKAERANLTKRFRAAAALESVDRRKAIEAYRSILADQPIFAEPHYRLARLLEIEGHYAEAGRHAEAARDHDGMPMRCTSPFEEAYRVVAREHDLILVDGPRVLRRLAPHGILDDHLFHDAHHPSLHGHVALATAVLKGLQSRRSFGWPKSARDPSLDPVAVAERFGLNAESFAHVCERAANFYERTAFLRYDPRERRAKRRAYLEAARRIREGVAPERTGIPGLGAKAKFGDEEVLADLIAPLATAANSDEKNERDKDDRDH